MGVIGADVFADDCCDVFEPPLKLAEGEALIMVETPEGICALLPAGDAPVTATRMGLTLGEMADPLEAVDLGAADSGSKYDE